MCPVNVGECVGFWVSRQVGLANRFAEMLFTSYRMVKSKVFEVSYTRLPSLLMDFPGGSDGKSVCLQCGRPGLDPWVGKIPWIRKWQPTPVLFPGKSHGWRSLVGYSPWGHKELDTTKQLHSVTHLGDTKLCLNPPKV